MTNTENYYAQDMDEAESIPRRLTSQAQLDRDEFNEAGFPNCSCHISAPCSSCTHTGNPINQQGDEFFEPDDEEMPPADPVLLASANRMLAERLAAVAHALRGSGLPELRDIDDGEELQQHVAALAGAYLMSLSEPAMLRAELCKADAEITDAAEILAPYVGGAIDSSGIDLHEIAEAVALNVVKIMADLVNAQSLAEVLKRNLASKEHECEALLRQAEAANERAAEKPVVGYYVSEKITTDAGTLDEAISLAMSYVRDDGDSQQVLEVRRVGTAMRAAEWVPE